MPSICSARPALPPAPRAEAALGGQQMAGAGVGPTSAGGAPLLTGGLSTPCPAGSICPGMQVRWGGAQGSAPPLWLPCPLPTRPSTAPRVSSSGHAICFLLGPDKQPRWPWSGRCQPLSAGQSGPGSLESPAGGSRGQSGWASGRVTLLGSVCPRPPPPAEPQVPPSRGHGGLTTASGDSGDPRQAGRALQLNTCLHPSRAESCSHGWAEASGGPAGMAVLQPGRASPVPTVKAVPETVSRKAL